MIFTFDAICLECFADMTQYFHFLYLFISFQWPLNKHRLLPSFLYSLFLPRNMPFLLFFHLFFSFFSFFLFFILFIFGQFLYFLLQLLIYFDSLLLFFPFFLLFNIFLFNLFSPFVYLLGILKSRTSHYFRLEDSIFKVKFTFCRKFINVLLGLSLRNLQQSQAYFHYFSTS